MPPPPTPHRPIILSGPSGTGKSTLLAKLFAAHPNTFGFSISHTTRAPRGTEQDGQAYHFVSRSTFLRLRDAPPSQQEPAFFIETAQFGSNLYGTSRAAVADVAASGRICVLDIEMEGVKQIKKRSDRELNARVCFLQPPSVEELERRLRGRGTDGEEAIAKRLAQARREMEYARVEGMGKGDKIVVNDEVERAYREFEEWVVDGGRFGS